MVQQIQPGSRIYTYIKGIEPGEIIAIGSTGYFREPRGGLRFCQRYTSKTSSMLFDSLSTQIDAWEPYSDVFGSWITTYRPIVDDNGVIIGGIGMDIEANQVDEVQAGILINVTTSFVITYIILFGLMYISGEGFTRLGQRKNSKQKI